MRFDNWALTPPPITASRTASELSSSKPSHSNKLPNTRRTFQAGRESPTGAATPRKLCTRPSALIKVPEVSVKEIGRASCRERVEIADGGGAVSGYENGRTECQRRACEAR